jgi:Alw26I/Eco31I/Esp3I family type II restriction m6 adenine DNA methyltransferase
LGGTQDGGKDHRQEGGIRSLKGAAWRSLQQDRQDRRGQRAEPAKSEAEVAPFTGCVTRKVARNHLQLNADRLSTCHQDKEGELARHHLELLDRHTATDGLGRSLYDRAAGRFYTPWSVADELALSALEKVPTTEHLRIVDPFCGDGRLVVAALRAAPKVRPDLARSTWDVSLWDLDPTAADAACESVRWALAEAGLDGRVSLRIGDSFEAAGEFDGAFDLVLTNPPWDVLKPDRRELSALVPDDAVTYTHRLREQSRTLVKRYPQSAPSLRFSGWGVNLARVGVELALRITSPTGVCGVVSPASLFADQLSAKLREWMLSKYSVTKVDYYPAEARLFSNVDQAVATFVAKPGATRPFQSLFRRFGADRNVLEEWDYRASDEVLRERDFSLPVHVSSALGNLLDTISHYPTFRDLESPRSNGLWAGREFDETGYRALVARDGHLFLKGRMIERYGSPPAEPVRIRDNGRQLPRSVAFERIVWRDVSRPSQARRVQATVIPGGWVTGNSLNVAYFRDQNPVRTRALAAIINSDIFEAQARAYLATAHVSLGTVRKCRVPNLSADAERTLASLAARRLAGDSSVESEINRTVAVSFGLDAGFDLLMAMQSSAAVRGGAHT